MFKRLICFFKGHKPDQKIQTKGKYIIYTCERCHVLFAKQED